MKHRCIKWSLLAALVPLVGSPSFAQEVVHAVAGVVTAVHPQSQSLAIQTHDGSIQTFRYTSKPASRIEFDKGLRSATAEPEVVKQTGDHVIVYYFGFGAQQTAVAIKDLGKDPLGYSTGRIVRVDRHKHTLTIHGDDGADQTFLIAEDAGADTPSGVVEGIRYAGSKGSAVIVRFSSANGSRVAHLVRED